jgi:transposase
MERIAMSQEERNWLEWLKRAKDGVVTQRQAAAKMGVSDRWVRKLLRRMEADGDDVVVHGLRGRSSNRQIDAQTQERAIVLLKQPEWHDFGPTFASEQLARRHDIHVNKETVRGWMVTAGLWKARPRKLGEAHFWRPRRSGYGELVQWDTSNHDWLEGQHFPNLTPNRGTNETRVPTVWTGLDLPAFTKAPFRELPFERSKTLPGSPEVIPGSSGWHYANPDAQRLI